MKKENRKNFRVVATKNKHCSKKRNQRENLTRDYFPFEKQSNSEISKEEQKTI